MVPSGNNHSIFYIFRILPNLEESEVVSVELSPAEVRPRQHQLFVKILELREEHQDSFDPVEKEENKKAIRNCTRKINIKIYYLFILFE